MVTFPPASGVYVFTLATVETVEPGSTIVSVCVRCTCPLIEASVVTPPLAAILIEIVIGPSILYAAVGRLMLARLDDSVPFCVIVAPSARTI